MTKQESKARPGEQNGASTISKAKREKILRSRGKNAVQLAVRLGCSPSQIYRIWNGTSRARG